MEEMIKNSTFTRALALLFSFLVLVAALVVATIEMLRGETINQYVLMVLGTGLGFTLNLLGVNVGVMLTSVKSTAKQEEAALLEGEKMNAS